MTPAIKVLDKAKIAYRIHEYEHDASASSYGLEAAEKLNLDPEFVYKTLVVSDGRSLWVAIISVDHQLDLKKMAKVLLVKKIAMADPKLVTAKTGYIMGGVSPLGQKTGLKTVISKTAESKEQIYISGGRRGLDIEINPQDLAKLLNASFEDI